mgnify:FL=1
MALSESELIRITAIEELLNRVQVAITNLASVAQLRQLLLLKQKDLDLLTERVSTLETEVQTLQSKL